MKRFLEPLAFLALATAVHAGAWIGFGAGTAPAGGGADGTSALTLATAGPELAAAIARWEAEPEASSQPAAPAAPEAPQALVAPTVPVADAPLPPAAGTVTAPPAQPAAPAGADAAPGADATRAAPWPDPVRPRPRSERRAARPAEAAATPAPERPAQRAGGSGQGPSAGASTATAAAAIAPSAGSLRALQAEWGAAILARIARQQRYPSGENGSGTARVVLTVARDGRLLGASLASSSGSPALDRAALEAVRRAGRFPAAPRPLAAASYSFRVPMTFRRN